LHLIRTGPETFSYKAEVDFDGTYLAAKLMPIYQQEFLQIRDSMDEELQVLLSLYAEDVIRTVEREVRHVEAYIRKKYPGAEYIELEPMSRDADRLAIDDNLEGELRRVESDALNRYLNSLRKEEAAKEKEYNDAQKASSDAQQASRYEAAAAATAADKKYYKDVEASIDKTADADKK
jgi:acetoin utilization deacetylase AcuC-like enzyme